MVNTKSYIEEHLRTYLENWSTDKEYVIYGAGLWFDRIYPFVKDVLRIRYIVDNDPQKQGTAKFGIPIFSMEHLLQDHDKPQVLFTVPRTAHSVIEENGIESVPFYRWVQFVLLSQRNQFYLLRTDFMITTACVLNCKDCISRIPYIMNKAHCEFAELQRDIDIFFTNVDMISEVTLVGGEPLIYPQFRELLAYFFDNFSDHFSYILIVTTGMVSLSKELLELCRKHSNRILISISDYGYNMLKAQKCIAKFEEYGIAYKYTDFRKQFTEDAWQWTDIGDPLKTRKRPPLETQKIFTDCMWNCGGGYYYRGKFYPCPPSVPHALIHSDHDDGYLLKQKTVPTSYTDLSTFEDILSRDLRITEKGYIDACTYCDGLGEANKRRVKPGKQI